MPQPTPSSSCDRGAAFHDRFHESLLCQRRLAGIGRPQRTMTSVIEGKRLELRAGFCEFAWFGSPVPIHSLHSTQNHHSQQPSRLPIGGPDDNSAIRWEVLFTVYVWAST
jgi:hypothetical protein